MAVIIDKIIIFIICLFSFFYLSWNRSAVIIVLIAISVSSLCYYFRLRKVNTILLIFYCGLCMLDPLFCIFLPLMLYDIIFLQLKILIIVSILLFLTYWYENTFYHIGISLFAILLSLIIQDRTNRYTKLQEKYKKLRDTSQELNIYLSNKNKMLIENQNYEIHLATLQERNRIAREIHDNVGHMLSRSILQVGALLTISKESSLSPNLIMLKDTLNEAMNSIRKSIHGLYDDSIDLKANIQGIIEQFKDYKIEFDYDMSDSVSKDVKYCFIMIIKEALSNTAKHSNANKIEIIVREHPVFYQLLIRDNGSKKSQNDSGIGIESMKTRVLNLNGNISIDQSDGFKIFVSIPKNNSGQKEK